MIVLSILKMLVVRFLTDQTAFLCEQLNVYTLEGKQNEFSFFFLFRFSVLSSCRGQNEI